MTLPQSAMRPEASARKTRPPYRCEDTDPRMTAVENRRGNQPSREILHHMTGPLTQFCLYPIRRIARSIDRGGIDDDDFDASALPVPLVEGATIEDISSNIRDDEFEFLRGHLADESIKQLKRVKYAIVHRAPDFEEDGNGGFLLSDALLRRSENIVAEIAACLRIIRPTSQKTQMISGVIGNDGTFFTRHLNDPLTFVDAPENQKHFTVRTSDIQDLVFYAPIFRQSMHDQNWKYRMAVQMHEAGHFQNTEWKVRYFLWSSALESFFTSKGPAWREHSGSMVASERIKALLDPSTSIYPTGELSSNLPNPGITIEDIIGEVYCVRNHIAHGDKVPDYYFLSPGRDDFNGPIPKYAVLVEAVSFLIRKSLLKIMKDGLVSHFQDAASSERFFSAQGLTKTVLKNRGARPFHVRTRSVKKSPERIRLAFRVCATSHHLAKTQLTVLSVSRTEKSPAQRRSC